MRAQDVANGFGVRANTVDARDEVTAVALEENAVFGPLIVNVVLVPGLFEDWVISGFRVEDEPVKSQH